MQRTDPNKVVGEIMISEDTIKVTFRSGHCATLKEVTKKKIVSLMCDTVLVQEQKDSLSQYFKVPIKFKE